jgi:hypothetical protein
VTSVENTEKCFKTLTSRTKDGEGKWKWNSNVWQDANVQYYELWLFCLLPASMLVTCWAYSTILKMEVTCPKRRLAFNGLHGGIPENLLLFTWNSIGKAKANRDTANFPTSNGWLGHERTECFRGHTTLLLNIHIIKMNAFPWSMRRISQTYASEIYILKLNSFELIQISHDIKLLIMP